MLGNNVIKNYIYIYIYIALILFSLMMGQSEPKHARK